MSNHKKTIVFAGNFGEFRSWCVGLGITIPDHWVRYASGFNSFRGFDPKKCQCIMTGNYHRNELWQSDEAQQFIKDSEWTDDDEIKMQTQKRRTSETGDDASEA